jgi:hypothetical protein
MPQICLGCQVIFASNFQARYVESALNQNTPQHPDLDITVLPQIIIDPTDACAAGAFQRLKKQVTSNWRLLEESPMSRTGLCLAPVPITLLQEAGKEVADPDIQAGQMSLSNWQPDIVCISFAKRKNAVDPEFTIPSDSSPEALTAAYDRKIKCHWPLTAALQGYVDSGWAVCTLPWVVGTRGMARHYQLRQALELLEIPKQKWTSMIECTVRSSVEVLRVRILAVVARRVLRFLRDQKKRYHLQTLYTFRVH